MPASSLAVQADASPPDAELLATRHAGRVRPRDTRALHRWLAALPAEAPSLAVAMRALEAAARWLRSGGALIESLD